MLYDRLPDNKVRCNLCSHRCVLGDGERGICRVRENRGGTLNTLVYGRTIAQHVDPIEKKPLFHFHPGTAAFSVATAGCNFQCRWCQNWEISQLPREQDFIPGDRTGPDQIVTAAQQAGCRSIAYTYTEPTIFFEYSYDTARIAREAGLANVYVSNGYMTEEMLARFAPYLDAINVDVKAFRDETYRTYVGARRDPVLQTLRTVKRLGIWLEVTTLVIPGINDGPAELRDAATFVAAELGPETPWHISRFFPAYQMTDVPPTPLPKLEEARDIGKAAGLQHVYLGNTDQGEDTFCSECGALLIQRAGYRIIRNRIAADGRCPDCGTAVAGIGMGVEKRH
jgi:pyruvate formate lyase activating enzyme